MVLFFSYTSIAFLSHVILFTGYKMLIALGIFVLPFFLFVFKICHICVNALNTKHVSIFDITEIVFFCFLLLLFCVFLDELMIYPGSPIRKIPNFNPGAVVKSSVPSADIKIPTKHEPAHGSIAGEMWKVVHNVSEKCATIVKDAGDPDSPENVEKATWQEILHGSDAARTDKMDAPEQATAKACAVLHTIVDKMESLSPRGSVEGRMEYTRGPLTDDDYEPAMSPGGTPRS